MNKILLRIDGFDEPFPVGFMLFAALAKIKINDDQEKRKNYQ